MKLTKMQQISTAAAVCMMVQFAGMLPVSAASGSLVDAGLNYMESTEYELQSPDSGYTSAIWINAAPGKDWSGTNVTKYSLLLIGIGGYSSGMNAEGVDYDFDDVFFTSLEAVLQKARANNATVGLRFRYDAEGKTNPEPASFEQVLRHIEQIGESGLLDRYEEVISFVETGMVGSWGEQWGGKYTSLEHKAQVLDAFLNITPDSIPVTVRTPNTVRQWLSDYCGISTTPADMHFRISDPDLAAKAARIGMYNDGYMGSDSDLGTYSNRAGETAWLHDAPSYGGEFSGSDAWRMKYITWQPEYALPEMYYTNLLRINGNIYKDKTDKAAFDTRAEAQAKLDEIDALYDACGLGSFNYNGTITEADGKYTASWKWMGYDDFTFDAALDAKLGVDCDNSAFYGQTVWQFIRAHLGYRFVLRSSKLTSSADAGDTMQMEFAVENTGFSETPKDKEVEVLLSNGEIVYTYTTDLNARDWASATYNAERVSVPLPETMPGGEWNVYLRISECNQDAIYDTAYTTRFANADLQYDEALGANYMGSIRISGTADAPKPVTEDKRAAGYYPAAKPIAVDETTVVNLLDQNYDFCESGHYGLTFLYKMEGVTEEMQLGNWYLNWSIGTNGYASAHTTYGLNTRNQSITEDGYYALHIPFYGAAFNCTDATIAGDSRLMALSFNDSRNYWSADTYTKLNGNSGVTITPIGFVEGGPEGYDVTFHLPDGDVSYTGSYGFHDEKSQSIVNVSAVTVLSLLDRNCQAQYTENGRSYVLAGYTTKEGDQSCLIDEDFIAIGTMELYPLYVLDRQSTNLNQITSALTNGADEQGIRYLLDDTTMTATVGDSGVWENNAGLTSSGSIILPAFVESSGKTYTVTSIGDNAFGSYTKLTEAVIPSTITSVGKNAFYDKTVLSVYADSPVAGTLQKEYTVNYLDATGTIGDVNMDGTVSVLDVVTLQKWILGQNVRMDMDAADCDHSGIINGFDLALLKRIVRKR